MTPLAERLAGIAASLPADQLQVAAELSALSVEVARLERAHLRPADVPPVRWPPSLNWNDPRVMRDGW